jgi:hypothetical protein
MKIEKLKEYYNKIDRCSINLSSDLSDFNAIQLQIAKTALYTEELNTAMGEILIEKTKLEHSITEKSFDYELKFAQSMMDNKDVKQFSTGKERKDYINYFILKDDYKELSSIKQELKDIESLLELCRKKAKDLDRMYPKLKTLWDAIQLEQKFSRGKGSDADYINKVKDSIDKEQQQKAPIFVDNVVEQIKEERYNNKDIEETEVITEPKVTDTNNEILDLDSILSDL